MTVRVLTQADWPEAEALYKDLTEGDWIGDAAMFATVLAHPGTTIWGLEQEGRLLAMATLHILPNVTYGGRPYALVENVVTATRARGLGCGRQVMTRLAEEARAAGCYKVMLLTGQGRAARGFYEALGYSADEKWGMILRFD
ncbi:MAG: GNAT family N-acetyltransferase [Paracoccaceae bacterium]